MCSVLDMDAEELKRMMSKEDETVAMAFAARPCALIDLYQGVVDYAENAGAGFGADVLNTLDRNRRGKRRNDDEEHATPKAKAPKPNKAAA